MSISILNNLKKFFLNHINNDNNKCQTKGRIVEVTIKKYYIIPVGAQISDETIKQEWFIDYANRSHAYKDNNHIGNADRTIEVKFLAEKDILELPENENWI